MTDKTVTVNPAKVGGRIAAPPSKSLMQRAIAIASLCEGTSNISNTSDSDDCLAALRVASGLGAQVNEKGSKVAISGFRGKRSETLNCGESGLGLRMFASLAALSDEEITLTGEGSLRSRPIGFFEEVLPQLGAQCKSNDGKLPLQVKGPLQGGEISIDGSLSSQFLTGLLIALPLAKEDSILHVKNLKSTPYIDMTMSVMDHFGVKVENDHYETFRIKGGQKYQANAFTVDGDWSGAAFLLVAGAIAGELTVEGINTTFTQADEAIIEALLEAGVGLVQIDDTFQVEKSDIQAFKFDATDCPDLFPPLIALAAHGDGVTKIAGVHRLKHKESDRAATLIDVFTKMGHKLWVEGDDLCIEPGEWLNAEVSSHGDHRIAMAAAVAALGGKSTTISGADAVNKSYPNFWEDLKIITQS